MKYQHGLRENRGFVHSVKFYTQNRILIFRKENKIYRL